MRPEVFILTTEPPERPGGMERFVGYVAAGLKERGYGVRVFHHENCVPPRWRRPHPSNKAAWLVAGFLQGYYIGKAARQALHPGVRLVLSNSTVGWFPLRNSVKQAHFYHGTYRGQAEAIRPFISYKGYLKLKWWDSMVLERWSGKGKIVLCCSELVREELKRFFGYEGHVMWNPIDLHHFRPMDQGACRQNLGVNEDRPVGLFVGSVHPVKGFPTVERLIHRFPDVQWLLALRGEVPDWLKDVGSVDVKVFQNATYDLLPILYNAADFSLCPSIYESFSYVVAEALSSGTPVIASPIGASQTFHLSTPLKPLLTNSASDVDDFVRAIQMVLSNPMEWRILVQDQVRPLLEELMAPENWWRRFLEVVGL